VDHLPPAEEETFVLDELAELARSAGSSSFQHGPILEPTPRYFPDRWRPDEAGALTLAHRLMEYAGLGHLRAEAVAFATEHRDDAEDTREIAAWFAGIENGCCFFGIQRRHLRTPEELAGILAHEVAHAYRHEHGLVRGDRDLEERLTDLTTIFLGFGILNTNLSDIGRIEKDAQSIRLRHVHGGYLSTETMAFALAVACTARRDAALVARVNQILEPGPARCFRASIEALYLAGDDLARRFRFSDTPSTTPITLPRKPQPSAPQIARSVWPGKLWGRVAYRARRGMIGRYAGAGFVGGFVLMQLSMSMLPRRHAAIAMSIWTASVLVGVAIGATARSYRCSRCGSRVEGEPSECASCAAYFLGDLLEPPPRFGTGDQLGKRVFRVRGHSAAAYFLWAMAIGGGLVIVLFPWGVPPGPAALGGFVVAIVASRLGARRPRYICSGASCETRLEPFLFECPRCLGEVHGEIADMSEKYEADEAAARAERGG
jgi:hypothetical protein